MTVYTSDTIAEQFGVVKASYESVPLAARTVLSAVCKGPGKPQEQLQLVAQPLPPELEWGQVLIEVKYAPITPADVYTARLGGLYDEDSKEPPFTAGHDAVAVVTKVIASGWLLSLADWSVLCVYVLLNLTQGLSLFLFTDSRAVLLVISGVQMGPVSLWYGQLMVSSVRASCQRQWLQSPNKLCCCCHVLKAGAGPLCRLPHMVWRIQQLQICVSWQRVSVSGQAGKCATQSRKCYWQTARYDECVRLVIRYVTHTFFLHVYQVGPGVKEVAEGDVVLPVVPLLGLWTEAAVVRAKNIVKVGKLAAGGARNTETASSSARSGVLISATAVHVGGAALGLHICKCQQQQTNM